METCEFCPKVPDTDVWMVVGVSPEGIEIEERRGVCWDHTEV